MATKKTKHPAVKKKMDIVSQQRIVETAAMLLSFKSRQYIVDHLTTNYGIQPRSCDKIITNAYKYIQNNYPVDRESITIKHIEFYYDLAMQWKDVDPRASLKALEQVEKLLRLHQDSPIIQNNTLSLNFEKISNEQLIEAINNIRKANGKAENNG